jgi:hypothetical protein
MIPPLVSVQILFIAHPVFVCSSIAVFRMCNMFCYVFQECWKIHSNSVWLHNDLVKRRTHSVKLSSFTAWHHTWRKNWVNCIVFTGNNSGLRTILSSRLSHGELRSSFSESHSFLSLLAHTTMASVSNNSFSRWASHDTFLSKYNFLLHILCFLFFFSDNIMADVLANSNLQPCFYPP